MSIEQNNGINKYIVCIAHPAYKNEWCEQIFETTKDKLKQEVTKKIYDELYESLKNYGGSNDITVEKIKISKNHTEKNMFDNIDPSQVEQKYGGKQPNRTQYW